VYYLEKQLEFSTGSVSKWDNSMPRADALLKVANYFNKPIDYFISEKGAD
jgi:transcriptional regulator with XRE-family HTH domain